MKPKDALLLEWMDFQILSSVVSAFLRLGFIVIHDFLSLLSFDTKTNGRR